MPELEVVELTSGIVPIPGPKGDKGDKGDTGATGPAGATGAAGPQGPQGNVGPMGPQGLEGQRGAQGLTGPIGATGPKGDKGDRGDTGRDGATGASGAQGPKGDRGDTGPQGPAGPAGEPGAAANGVYDFRADANVLTIELTDGTELEAILDGVGGGTGPAGENGTSVDSLSIDLNGHLITTFTDGRTQDSGYARGDTGPQGPKGDKGDKGDTGDTGPAGAASTVPGPQGPKGDTGATGAKGDTGSQGLKGDTGSQGAPGQGVPSGGSAGQVLRKVDATDYNAAWATPATGTVTTLSVTTANGVSGTVSNATTTPAISLTLGAITPTSVAATGTVTGSNIVRGFNAFCGGKPAANETLFFYRAPYAYTATATNSTADALVAATASTVFTIKKGTTTVGTFTFAAGATTATKSITSGAIAKGDLVTIVAPATADATLSDITFNVLV